MTSDIVLFILYLKLQNFSKLQHKQQIECGEEEGKLALMSKNSTINSQKNSQHSYVISAFIFHLLFYFTLTSSSFTNEDVYFHWKLFGLDSVTN